MASNFRQEMPPPGGYQEIQWARKFGKSPSGYRIFGSLAAISGLAWVGYMFEIAAKKFMKQLWENREEENKLMKDVPGWVTGTYYGEPTYHNAANRFKQVAPEEYYAHNRWADMYDRMFERRRH